MGGANKTSKKDYFTKNLSSPTFFEINTSNFQEMFNNIFIKYVGRNLKNYFWNWKIAKKNSFFFVIS